MILLKIKPEDLFLQALFIYSISFFFGEPRYQINLVKEAQKQDPTGATVNLELRHR